MPKSIPLVTAKAALEALDLAYTWIGIGEEGSNPKESFFRVHPSLDRRRAALRRAIAKAEGR